MTATDRQKVVNAYRRLARGEPRPLIELLAADVIWNSGHHATSEVQGAVAVAEVITSAVAKSRPIELSGIQNVRDGLELEFRHAWWEERLSLRTLTIRALSGRFVQRLAFDHGIRRIDNHWDLVRDSLFPAGEESYLALLAPRL